MTHPVSITSDSSLLFPLKIRSSGNFGGCLSDSTPLQSSTSVFLVVPIILIYCANSV